MWQNRWFFSADVKWTWKGWNIRTWKSGNEGIENRDFWIGRGVEWEKWSIMLRKLKKSWKKLVKIAVEAREGLVDWNMVVGDSTFLFAVEAREGLVDWNVRRKTRLFAFLVEAREGLVDWNILNLRRFLYHFGRGPWGPCGLKYSFLLKEGIISRSRPVRALWIEISKMEKL